MEQEKINSDILQVQGRMTLGYGIIPKLPMQDRRLTIEAKAIYSYFCSYAGAGTTAFPSKNKILYDLQISENRYYKHFNLLKDYGYIQVSQNTDSKGKFKNNIYTLIEMIEPHLQNEGTDKKPYLQNPCPDNPCSENEGTKNNTFKINKYYNQQSSQSQTEPKTDLTLTVDNDIQLQQNYAEMKKEPINPTFPYDGLTDPFKSNKSNTRDDYTTYKEIIQENIEYSYFLHNRRYDMSEIDELIECMLDVICTKGDTVKIGGEDKNRGMVVSQYLKINSIDIEHVIDQFKGQHHKITHLYKYLQKMLYTVKQEGNHYYTNRVRADGVIY